MPGIFTAAELEDLVETRELCNDCAGGYVVPSIGVCPACHVDHRAGVDRRRVDRGTPDRREETTE